MRPSRRCLTLLASLAVLGAGSSAAQASVTVTSLKVTPSTTAAGGHPNLAIVANFSYSAGDTLKSLVFHLPAGLAANPQVPAKCSETQFEADGCPAPTLVGSTSVTAQVGGLVPTTSSGDVYNVAPLGAEVARLGIIVRPAAGSKIFLSSPASIRTTGDFGIDSHVDQIPNQTGGLPLTITSMSLTLNSSAGSPAGPFTLNPSSCIPATTRVDASSYGAPSTVASASDAFTPTACDRLAFDPQVDAGIVAPDPSTADPHPSFTATITQAATESTTGSAMVALPAALGPNLQATQSPCTSDQLASGSCPAKSLIGSAQVISPLLGAPLAGPVYLVAHPGSFPGLAVVLSGPLSFNLNAAVALGPGLINTFSGLPDVPLTAFRLTVNGGPGGLLNATPALCSAPQSLHANFSGHNGATVASSFPVKVTGCPANSPGSGKPAAPAASASLSGLLRHPQLVIRVRQTSAGQSLSRISLSLPSQLRARSHARGLSFVLRPAGGRAAGHLSGRGALSVVLPRGVSSLTARLGAGAFGPSASLLTSLRAHRHRKLTLRLIVTDGAGRRSQLTLRVLAQG